MLEFLREDRIFENFNFGLGILKSGLKTSAFCLRKIRFAFFLYLPKKNIYRRAFFIKFPFLGQFVSALFFLEIIYLMV